MILNGPCNNPVHSLHQPFDALARPSDWQAPSKCEGNLPSRWLYCLCASDACNQLFMRQGPALTGRGVTLLQFCLKTDWRPSFLNRLVVVRRLFPNETNFPLFFPIWKSTILCYCYSYECGHTSSVEQSRAGAVFYVSVIPMSVATQVAWKRAEQSCPDTYRNNTGGATTPYSEHCKLTSDSLSGLWRYIFFFVRMRVFFLLWMQLEFFA